MYANTISPSRTEHELFLSKMCHELGNPLTLIYSTIQLMESRNPEIKELALWNQLTSDTKDLSDLFHELSNYNHSSEINPSVCDLYEMLADLIDSFDAHAAAKNVTLYLDESNLYLPALEYSGDVTKLRQTFTNLLKNALEAASDDSTIEISIYPDENPPIESTTLSPYIAISIQNDGPVIPSELINDIFTPFISTKVNGSGLGLPISRKIVQAHGGDILVDSSDLETVFTVFLPTTNYL